MTDAETTSQVTAKKNEILKIEMKRVQGHTELYIQISPAIAEVLAAQSDGETNSSRQWSAADGRLEFLSFTDSAFLTGIVSKGGITAIDSYGDTLWQNGKINAAVFRTVGLVGGKTLKFNAVYPDEIMTELVRSYRNLALQLQRNYVRKVVVRATLTIEDM